MSYEWFNVKIDVRVTKHDQFIVCVVVKPVSVSSFVNLASVWVLVLIQYINVQECSHH